MGVIFLQDKVDEKQFPTITGLDELNRGSSQWSERPTRMYGSSLYNGFVMDFPQKLISDILLGWWYDYYT